MKLIHVAETIKGGVATYIKDVVKLQAKDPAFSAVVIIVPATQVQELSGISGVEIVSFDDTRSRFFSSLVLAWEVRSYLRRKGGDIIHLHSTFAGLSVRPILRLFRFRCRIVYCAHGWAWDRPLSAAKRSIICFLEKTLSLFCDRVVCISEHDYNSAICCGIEKNRLFLARNAVSEEAVDPLPIATSSLWPAGKRRILFVGRFDRQKGLDVLLDAAFMMIEEAHIVLAGAPVVDSGLVMKLPSNVSSVGWVSAGQLEWLFSQADVLVIPSRWEGFGLVAVEAMRAGLPVVASDVGGLSEVVVDGETGFLVKPESPVAIVSAVKEVDIERRAQMGEAGRRRARDLFSISRLHRELLSLYSSLV